MVMGQRTQLWWDLPAWDSFLLNKEIYEIPKAQFEETVEELSRLLEIQDLLDVPVKKLSLGQRMKAELACSLLHRPRVLLLDEPTIGLDVVMQQIVRQFILEYNKRYRATVLLTSHNMEDIAELCPRVLLINHGQILFDGSLDSFRSHYQKNTLTEAMRFAFKVPGTLK
jgi:ABC-2 type transport system ATP-binding protein